MTTDPWGEWYDTYRRQRDRNDAEAAAMKRQIDWMTWIIVLWTALICTSTVAVIWFLFW